MNLETIKTIAIIVLIVEVLGYPLLTLMDVIFKKNSKEK